MGREPLSGPGGAGPQKKYTFLFLHEQRSDRDGRHGLASQGLEAASVKPIPMYALHEVSAALVCAAPHTLPEFDLPRRRPLITPVV